MPDWDCGSCIVVLRLWLRAALRSAGCEPLTPSRDIASSQLYCPRWSHSHVKIPTIWNNKNNLWRYDWGNSPGLVTAATFVLQFYVNSNHFLEDLETDREHVFMDLDFPGFYFLILIQEETLFAWKLRVVRPMRTFLHPRKLLNFRAYIPQSFFQNI